ncbi:CRISPR-associated endonuclease Cas1 [Magnetovirga frankeli]|uniref:CRISPR-associated endonuclease Cas1 n=1 Tax=Magnetovirga frankeli TaxID=947516 RepID=UPI001293C58E|nr:CRISPR-associated endonuclease Cas1 [gamma proteobacterium SS-5]
MTSTLYLDHRDIQLSLHGKALHIHRDGALERTLPLSLVEHIVCQASVGLKTGLLASLSAQGIGLTFFGGYHNQESAHLGVAGARDVMRRLGQYQLYLDPAQRLAWSIRLMQHKLQRQRRLLLRARRRRADLRHPLTQGIDSLARLQQGLRHSPPTTIDSLRGIEGSGARCYFQAYASLFADSLGFAGRQRRPPPDPVNALLSLGYTLLNGAVQQAVAGAGLDPWLGFYHEPYHGRASLVCDLVEPFRPHIDALVWQLLSSRTLRADHFGSDSQPDEDGHSQTRCLLNKPGRALFYPLYEAHAKGWRPQLRHIAQALALQLQQSPNPPLEP